MKSYQEFLMERTKKMGKKKCSVCGCGDPLDDHKKDKLKVETVGDSELSKEDRQLWMNLVDNLQRAGQSISRTNAYHALILNDIDHAMSGLKEVLNKKDMIYRWRDEIRKRGGKTTE